MCTVLARICNQLAELWTKTLVCPLNVVVASGAGLILPVCLQHLADMALADGHCFLLCSLCDSD